MVKQEEMQLEDTQHRRASSTFMRSTEFGKYLFSNQIQDSQQIQESQQISAEERKTENTQIEELTAEQYGRDLDQFQQEEEPIQLIQAQVEPSEQTGELR